MSKDAQLIFVESNTTGTGRIFARVARQMGYRPVLLTGNPERYPYIKQDSIRHVPCDTSSIAALRQAVEQTSAENCIAGIFSSSEYFILVAALLAQSFGLPGPDPIALKTTRNKWLQRQILERAGLHNPEFRLVTSVQDARDALSQIPLPVILKPTVGSGSVGVKLCATMEEVIEHATLLLQCKVNERGMPLPAEILVEEYLRGNELSVEILNGSVIGITQKHVSREPFFVETGHDFPAELPQEMRGRIIATVDQALRALGLTWGPIHIELKCGSTCPAIIEINPRLAGGFIPEIVHMAIGVDMIRETLRSVVGQAADENSASHQQYASIRFLFPAKAGSIKGFSGIDEARQVDGIAEIQLYRKVGDAVQIHNDFRDRIGHVITCSECRKLTGESAEKARKMIHIDIQDFN